MNPSLASNSTRFKVGLFTLAALILIGGITVFVNDKPFWWRGCQLVHINVEDATGLKTKSPIRSLGLQIGYLKSVELTETYVRLGICITAPVDVLPDTRGYIRAEGFLGDKFVELKPVRYIPGGASASNTPAGQGVPATVPTSGAPSSLRDQRPDRLVPLGEPVVEPDSVRVSALSRVWNWIVPSVSAAEPVTTAPAARNPAEAPNSVPATGATPASSNSKDIPVGKQSQDLQHVVNQVDSLVSEMTQLTQNLKQAIDPKELRNTMTQLNKTLENASRTLSPEGGLNTTAQRTLAKLEEAIENLRDIMSRINKGQGSIGMLINDPTYAEEIREAVRNVNRLLGKVGEMRFVVNLGGEQIVGYNGGRAWFQLSIWPRRDRYYLLGATNDPRGKRTVKNYTNVAGGITTTSQVTEVEEGGLLLTVMLGKVFMNRIDLSLGILHGDGAISGALLLGPTDHEDMITLRSDTYSRGKGYALDDRVSLVLRPWSHSAVLSSVYIRGGLESIHKVDNKTALSYGAGLTFDDQDIKLLFALR